MCWLTIIIVYLDYLGPKLSGVPVDPTDLSEPWRRTRSFRHDHFWAVELAKQLFVYASLNAVNNLSRTENTFLGLLSRSTTQRRKDVYAARYPSRHFANHILLERQLQASI